MLEVSEEVAIDSNQLRALSSDTRIEILKLLASRNHTVSEIARKLNCSKSTVHEHIKKLEEARLVERIENGYAPKWVYYRLTKKGTMLFDKSRRIVLILAGLFICLAFAQMLFLLMQWQSFLSSSYIGEQKMPLKAPANEIVSANEESRAVLPESGDSLTRAQSEMPVLFYGVLISGAIGIGLAFYALKKPKKLIIRQKKQF